MQDGSLQAAVVGAGTMGTTLAKLMATHGVKVTVVDTNPQVLEASRLSVGESAAVICFTTNLEVAKSADFVIESVTEDVAIKRKVVAQIESEVADTCIIVTNTSGIPIDDIGSAMRVPQRFLGTHFFNPADIIPAVEVVPGSHTEAAVVKKVCGWLKRWGKRPAVLNTCVPGFVANRIQHAVMRECLSLLEKGVVEAEALDDIVQYSIGVRMALNGPLCQRDLNGLDTHLNIAHYLYADLEARQQPAALLEEYVAQGRLGAKAGQGFYQWSDETRTQHQARERENLQRIIEIATQHAGGDKL
ncbi:MAG: 3-hydroxyacyl-CoA dehydrogenase NAD-binding domain-containing protein [Vreelandella alkaliphila]|uniref:3-hydroxyacyl-CoA dehydrogenase n=1 Tax=Halomonas campaniensis TaxID=213554 RepID=A0A3D0KB42_9GAMM|nr:MULTISPECIES: 3-hydroxyacyl-CoA dehydrogenase NAD-binding domain-containing protein [unclassified Halomonas]HBP41960.1 3-hydroxyacyl-CoA dehydrogenase [Halomonas sp.]HBS84660.1 3-hydroxyacyl-CoA dehydrogenase [Halomonas campaniensis]HCA00767.1 3-hydroxyacyl-CoA dehydrogenase [Halomonas campaniensis]